MKIVDKLTRRQVLAGAAAVVVRSQPVSLASALPPGYVTDGSLDYSAQVQRVFEQLRERGGGEVVVPRNTTILVGDLVTYANIVVRGDDHTAVLKVRPGSYGISLNPGAGGTPNPADNARNVAFRGFTLLGQVQAAGFSEHKHLLNLNAFTHLAIEDMLIAGFQGDGVYCGSSNQGHTERHNLDFIARRVKFDGVNSDNRNALSFIDIDGALVEDCEFTRCTRQDMPGPIDMEPDANPFAIIRNVTIQRCRFAQNGGGVAEVSVVVPAAVARPPSAIKVTQCSSSGYVGRGSFFHFTTNRQPEQASPFELSGNTVSGASRPYMIAGARGGKITGNTFENCRRPATLGTDALPVREIERSGNSFVRCGPAER